MRRSFVMMAAVLLVFMAGPAAAMAPEQVESQLSVVVEDGGGEACGFPLRWHIQGTARSTNFFDNDGSLVRVLVHVAEENTLTRLDTGEVVIDGPVRFNQRVEFNPDGSFDIVTSGLFSNAGSGSDQVKDVGLFLWTQDDGVRRLLFSAGKHALLEQSETRDFIAWMGAFCSLFD